MFTYLKNAESSFHVSNYACNNNIPQLKCVSEGYFSVDTYSNIYM